MFKTVVMIANQWKETETGSKASFFTLLQA